MLTQEKKNPFSEKVCTGGCLQPQFVPLQLAMSSQNQMALIIFKAKIGFLRLLWFKCKSYSGTLRSYYLIVGHDFSLILTLRGQTLGSDYGYQIFLLWDWFKHVK